MRKNFSHLVKATKRILLKSHAVTCSLIILFSCFIAFDQSLTQVFQNGHLNHSDINFVKNNHHPNQLPFQADQVPEIPDEVESSDNFDDTLNKNYWCPPSSATSNLRSGRSLLLHLKNSLESRSEISLFVLHHSWKSFLI